MSKEPTDKPITITLGADFNRALHHFKKTDRRHLSIVEQVRRALICYWIQQTEDMGETVAMVLPGYEPGDENFRIVHSDSPEGQAIKEAMRAETEGAE